MSDITRNQNDYYEQQFVEPNLPDNDATVIDHHEIEFIGDDNTVMDQTVEAPLNGNSISALQMKNKLATEEVRMQETNQMPDNEIGSYKAQSLVQSNDIHEGSTLKPVNSFN